MHSEIKIRITNLIKYFTFWLLIYFSNFAWEWSYVTEIGWNIGWDVSEQRCTFFYERNPEFSNYKDKRGQKLIIAEERSEQNILTGEK